MKVFGHAGGKMGHPTPKDLRANLPRHFPKIRVIGQIGGVGTNYTRVEDKKK